jgi:2-oxoisovalerate dehydrogenase E2 component (dihydrolipoyl transacylase)
MAKEFLLPELAESVVEGEIVQWLVSEGDPIKEDQPLVEVMTDKVTVELPSPFSGVLEKQLVKVGDVVPVHSAIATIAEATQSDTEPAAADSAKDNGAPDGEDNEDSGESLSLFKPSSDIDTSPVFQVRRETKAASQPKATGPYGRVLAVPAARKLARELGISLEQVSGSGPNGRVRVGDVKAFAQQTEQKPQPNFKRVGYQPGPYSERETRIPVRGLRRVISQQMVASHLQTVRTLHVDEADVSALVALRQKLKGRASDHGVKLSFLPFIMKAVVSSLRAFPTLNASLDEDKGEIVQKHYYNLGMAVATEQGLVVPVIHEVDQKSVLELASDVQTLAEKARNGKLAPEDVRHGSFSITNIGSLGGLFSFPIINVPEAAILGVHSIKRRPVVLDNDQIVPRDMLYLSLSFDHRLVDGAEAARFTSYLIDILETPERLLLES